jgi:hypothetical protein
MASALPCFPKLPKHSWFMSDFGHLQGKSGTLLSPALLCTPFQTAL